MIVQQSRSNKIVLIPILLVILGVFMATYLNRHALERHPLDAPQAVSCLDKNGADFEMFDPSTKRTAQVCHDPLDNTVWYVIIFCAAGTLVTAFRRHRAKCRRDVETYLRDGGWQFPKRR